jgi:hypothetical protein
MDHQTAPRKKLVVPAVLAVAVLATGCTGTTHENDGSVQNDTAVADAGAFDAGCVPPEEYDPVSHTCIPVV